MTKILAAVVFMLVSHPVLTQAAPPIPDTSATGTVPDMSQRLGHAKSELDRVEAQSATLRQNAAALDQAQATRKSDAHRLTERANQLVKAWNDKAKAFEASCGGKPQMHDPEYTDCFHWVTELNDEKAEIDKVITQSKESFNTIKQEFDRNIQQQLAYQHDLQDLNSWKSQTSAGIQSLEAAILKKCKPLGNCPTL